MKTTSPPPPAVSLAPQLYFQLVHTLTSLLPPPLDDSPDALRTRNLAAIAKVAAMLPVNANETDLAAQCVAARAQAEDVMRLIREHAGDIALTTRLNAQYMAMIRTSLSVEARLLRVQALRQKREAIEGAVDQDDRRRQAVEQCMLIVADPGSVRLAASPHAARENTPRTARAEAPRMAPEAVPAQAPVAAPASHGILEIAENVSQNDPNSHGVAFETGMSEHALDQEEERELRAHMSKAVAALRLAWREAPADGRESPGSTGQPGRPAECPDGVRSGQPMPKDEQVSCC